MSKLATPVQYEPSLDGLNEVRPLTLADEAKTVLNIPALGLTEFNLVGESNSRLLRCNQVGAALKNGEAFGKNTEYKNVNLNEFNVLRSVTFSQQVKGVVAQYTCVMCPGPVFWCNESGDINFSYMTKDVWKYLPFVGKIIWFRAVWKPVFVARIYLYGFY